MRETPRSTVYLVRDRKLDRLEYGKLHVFQILAALLLQLLVEGVVGILQRERILPATLKLQTDKSQTFFLPKLRCMSACESIRSSDIRTTEIWSRNSRHRIESEYELVKWL